MSELIADYRVLRPGKGGGRERLVWAFAKIEAAVGAARIGRITAREVEVWIAAWTRPALAWR